MANRSTPSPFGLSAATCLRPVAFLFAAMLLISGVIAGSAPESLNALCLSVWLAAICLWLQRAALQRIATSICLPFSNQRRPWTLLRIRRLRSFFVFLAAVSLPMTAATAAAQTNFGSVNVGGSGAALVTLTIPSAVTLGSIAVVMKGAENLDFNNAGGGTCAVGTAYASNATCTVIVTFKPELAGTRYGAVVLSDNSGNAIATVYLEGTGHGPQVAFAPGTESVVPTVGLSNPSGVAVDGNGNLYVSDPNNGRVLKETWSNGNYSQSTIFSGLNYPGALAIDGGGNIYISTHDDQLWKETWSNGGYSQSKVGSGLNQPNTIVIDGSGNLFIADDYNGRVVKETLSGGSYTQSVILTCGFVGGQSCPSSVAVDASGKLFVTAYNSSQILELTPSGTAYTQSNIGGGLVWPSCIMVDGSDNLYIADTLNSRIVKETLTAGSYVQSTVASSSIDWPWAVAVDGSGNVYIADTYNLRVLKEDLGDLPTLRFANTAVGSTSSDSPRTVQVQNIGNAAMTLMDVGYPTDFPVEDGGGTDHCASSTSLSAGQQCDLNVDFMPQSLASFSENVTLTDNALNVSGAQQAISVTGIGGTAPVATLSATSMGFGGQAVGTTSAEQYVTLTNTGTGALSNLSITETGANASAFPFKNNCGSSLAAGAYCTVYGYFTPTALGPMTATIAIADNAAGSPQLITLSGMGVSLTTVSLSPANISFGNVGIGTQSATKQAILTNTGAATLYISSIADLGVSPEMVFTTNCGSALATGASCTIQGYFKPTVPEGVGIYIYIADNTLNSPQLLTVGGAGVSTTTVSPSATSLSFGDEEVGTASASQDVTLTNTGGTPLSITSVGVTGADASSFILANNCGKSVAVGASCTIHGHFTPAAAGTLTAAITITGNATGSPLSVALSGTGYGATTATLSATSLVFGIQEEGTSSASQVVTLTNTGSATLLISNIAATGADASSFVFANSCGTSLTAGASCLIHGHFTPTAEGVLTAGITVFDSALSSPHNIALTGTGYAAPTTLSLSATSIAFGDQAVGTASGSRHVILTNTGTTALAIASIAVNGANASSFVFGSTDTYSIANSCGPILAAGASCLIHGHFAPTAPGALTAAVTIKDSATSSPQTIALSGTGR